MFRDQDISKAHSVGSFASPQAFNIGGNDVKDYRAEISRASPILETICDLRSPISGGR